MSRFDRPQSPKPRQGRFFEPNAVGAPPPPRADHCCVALGRHVVVHGGNSAHGPLEDMYVLSALGSGRARPWRWERVHPSGDVPAARFGHALVRLSDTAAILFGGADDNEYRWYNDSYILRFQWAHGAGGGGATLCSSMAANPSTGGAAPMLPTPRCGHSLERVPSSHATFVMFGGSNTRGALNDLWHFDADTMRWAPAGRVDGSPPPPRAFHASATVQRAMLVVGGRNGYEYLNDAYTLHTTAGRWTRLAWSAAGSPFPALAYHHLAPLPGGRLLVFGGFGADGTTALHAAIDVDLSRATWRRGDDLPRARSNHSVVALTTGDAATEAWGAASDDEPPGPTVLIFGGFDGHDFCAELLGLQLHTPGAPGGADGGAAVAAAEREEHRAPSAFERLSSPSLSRPPSASRPRSAPSMRSAVTSPSVKASALAAARAYSASGPSAGSSAGARTGGAYGSAGRARAQSVPSRGGAEPAGGVALRARDSLEFGAAPLVSRTDEQQHAPPAPPPERDNALRPSLPPRRPPSPFGAPGARARASADSGWGAQSARTHSPAPAYGGYASDDGAATSRSLDSGALGGGGPLDAPRASSVPRHRTLPPGRSVLRRRPSRASTPGRVGLAARPRTGAAKPRLRFAMVHVREFERGVEGDGVPGDGGAPLTLTDTLVRESSVRMADWELARRHRRIPVKRFVEEGRLDAEQREELLLRAGVSADELQHASQEAADMWAERHESNVLDTYGLQPEDLAAEMDLPGEEQQPVGYADDGGGAYGDEGGGAYDDELNGHGYGGGGERAAHRAGAGVQWYSRSGGGYSPSRR